MARLKVTQVRSGIGTQAEPAGHAAFARPEADQRRGGQGGPSRDPGHDLHGEPPREGRGGRVDDDQGPPPAPGARAPRPRRPGWVAVRAPRARPPVAVPRAPRPARTSRRRSRVGRCPSTCACRSSRASRTSSRSCSRWSTWTGSPSCSRSGGAGRPGRAGRGRRGPQGPAGQGPRHRRPGRREAPGVGARVQRVGQGEDRRRRRLRHRAVRSAADRGARQLPAAGGRHGLPGRIVRQVPSDRLMSPGAICPDRVGLLESVPSAWIVGRLARAPTPTRRDQPAAASRRRKKLLSAFLSAFRTPDLRKKLLFTVASSRSTGSARRCPARASRTATCRSASTPSDGATPAASSPC